jgi:BirA family biotin operon repressor/biotin-[acetyl-CoA-carboxylase] ligase
MTRNFQVPSGCRLIAHETVGSTNEEAKRLAETGATDGTAVWALEQTAGRGRHGRQWSSPKGNLYLSAVFRPKCRIAEAPQLGFVVGVAMASAIRALSDIPAELKWPNDLLVSGKKVSGILLDSSDGGAGGVAWVIAGVGVNVEVHPEDIDGADSLRAFGATFSVEELLEAFLSRLFDLIGVWSRDGFEPIRICWQELALATGTLVSVKLPDQLIGGTFEGIDPSGNLLLRHNDEVLHVAAGDVFPVSAATNTSTGAL